MKRTPGDYICILVDGTPVETVIDNNGTQRFVANEVITWLFETGQLDINRLWRDFYTNPDCGITNEHMIEFYMGLGYTVGGFDEVFGSSSSWHDNGREPVEILNPVWEREVETVH